MKNNYDLPILPNMNLPRCAWVKNDVLAAYYHDYVYGKPISDENGFFEKLCMEIFQAGLSWRLILHKQKALKKAFDDFNPQIVKDYDEVKIKSLLSDKNLIRNRRKIEAVIYNASAFLKVSEKWGGFGNFIDSLNVNDLNDCVKRFKKHFKFIGPKMMEEFLISCGKLPPIHEKECFMYAEKTD